jgi:integrase
MRRGEVCGLRWEDVDFDSRVVRVRQQVVQLAGRCHIGPPKTKSGTRTIALDRGTADVLRAHRGRQNVERDRWGDAWVDSGLVFTREDGALLLPNHVTYHFRALVQSAELPVIRFHGLRHTAASVALAAGVAMKTVSDRLGHSSTAITADLYTHVSPAVAQDAADRIAEVIAGRASVASRTSEPGNFRDGKASSAERELFSLGVEGEDDR